MGLRTSSAIRSNPSPCVCDVTPQPRGATRRLGGTGEQSTLIKGFFQFAGRKRSLLEGMPRSIRLTSTDPTLHCWTAATHQLLLAETSSPGPDSVLVLQRLADVLFIQALRTRATQRSGLAALASRYPPPRLRNCGRCRLRECSLIQQGVPALERREPDQLPRTLRRRYLMPPRSVETRSPAFLTVLGDGEMGVASGRSLRQPSLAKFARRALALEGCPKPARALTLPVASRRKTRGRQTVKGALP